MKGFNIEIANTLLLIVILLFVIVNCVKQENFNEDILEKIRKR